MEVEAWGEACVDDSRGAERGKGAEMKEDRAGGEVAELLGGEARYEGAVYVGAKGEVFGVDFVRRRCGVAIVGMVACDWLVDVLVCF